MVTDLRAALAPLAIALQAASAGAPRQLHAAREVCVSAVQRTAASPGVHVYAALVVALHEELRVS